MCRGRGNGRADPSRILDSTNGVGSIAVSVASAQVVAQARHAGSLVIHSRNGSSTECGRVLAQPRLEPAKVAARERLGARLCQRELAGLDERAVVR